MTRLPILAALLLLSAPAGAQDEIRVIDGDTFEMAGETIRLWGIDAPELRDACQGQATGRIARDALENLVARQALTCQRPPIGSDRSHNRIVRQCVTADGIDIARAMVVDGWAADCPRYSDGAYTAEMEAARIRRWGVWGYGCDPGLCAW